MSARLQYLAARGDSAAQERLQRLQERAGLRPRLRPDLEALGTLSLQSDPTGAPNAWSASEMDGDGTGQGQDVVGGAGWGGGVWGLADGEGVSPARRDKRVDGGSSYGGWRTSHGDGHGAQPP